MIPTVRFTATGSDIGGIRTDIDRRIASVLGSPVGAATVTRIVECDIRLMVMTGAGVPVLWEADVVVELDGGAKELLS